VASFLSPGNIGDWDQATLVKFVQEIITGQLGTAAIQALKADNVAVVKELVIANKATVLSPGYRIRKIGDSEAPAFANGWVNFSASQPATFYKDPFGRVYLSGLIKTGTVGSAAFTLPPGFRPAYQQSLDTISNNAQGRVDITVGGAVTPVSPSSNTWVSLDGLSFRVP
jgi:hypothetical protein